MAVLFDRAILENIISIESPFIKVLVEKLKKNVRYFQKQIEKEMNIVNDLIDQIDNSYSLSQDIPTKKALYEKLLNKLLDLQNELKISKKEEKSLIGLIRDRTCEFLSIESSPYTESQLSDWNKRRMDRLLMDYMLRSGYQKSAKTLAKDNSIAFFCDSDLFEKLISIDISLSKNKSCSECLVWCLENKISLRKLNSDLEFELRLQEFIELARNDEKIQAITYAKKHFKSLSEPQSSKFKQAMTLLVMSPSVECKRYKSLYSPDRWLELTEKFRSVSFSLYGLPSMPILLLLLQAGISCLKTRSCSFDKCSDESNKNCPICSSKALNTISKELPLAYHTNSSLVCRISGLKMDENNPPMRLPNGYVYSFNALKEMSDKGEGIIQCPRSGDSFSINDCTKIFQFDCMDTVPADFNFHIASIRYQELFVYPVHGSSIVNVVVLILQKFNQFGRVFQQAHEHENLRHAVVGKHSQFVDIVEMAKPGILETCPYFGTEYLRPLIKHRFSTTAVVVVVVVVVDGTVGIAAAVVVAAEIRCQRSHQRQRATLAAQHDVFELAAKLFERHCAELVEHARAAAEQLNLALTPISSPMSPENMPQLIVVHGAQILWIQNIDTIVNSAIDCRTQRPVPAIHFTLVLDLVNGLPDAVPETKVQRVDNKQPAYCSSIGNLRVQLMQLPPRYRVPAVRL
ncbi:Macrophage erythroblast attacher [Smittium culicis]|uniref:Macrophage erythroblast attacher n=1 Tax=Smittium culicis TaxID=133412 RepID=A0A1R1XI19_9FUNG|nr:Macrophage erythroblast attacher [Smittium culicis]